jgi:hypothetical protein
MSSKEFLSILIMMVLRIIHTYIYGIGLGGCGIIGAEIIKKISK